MKKKKLKDYTIGEIAKICRGPIACYQCPMDDEGMENITSCPMFGDFTDEILETKSIKPIPS